MSNGVLLLLRLSFACAACAGIVYLGYLYTRDLSGMLIGAILSSPILAVSIARPLVEFAHEGITWLARRPLAKYEGCYYAFDSAQVRIQELHDRLLFHARDVAIATQLEAIPWRDHDEYVDLATLERWLHWRRDPMAGRFLLWARREVVGPWERKKEMMRRC